MLHAQKVLEDCKRAHELLELETEESKFRLFWVAGIALARSIGHVLVKVDSKQNYMLSRIIQSRYDDWKANPKENKIFWDFIEDERNRLLKEYTIGFLSQPIQIIIDNQKFTLDEKMFCPLTDGEFAGEDCRDVLKDAIEWWEVELEKIETQFTLPDL